MREWLQRRTKYRNVNTLESRHGGQITRGIISTLLVKPNIRFHLPTDAAPQVL